MKRYPGLCLVIMIMAMKERNCVLCATNIVLPRTITCYGAVIQCIKGVMGLQKVWGTGNCKGGDIGNWEECVGGEDEVTGIILMEMFSCNSKLYPIIISEEKYWSFSQSEACRCGKEVICLSFWMGHLWGPLQTICEHINQLYYLWRVPGFTFYKAICEAFRLIACGEAFGVHS